MENFKVSDILSIIEIEQLEWQDSCERVCKDDCLSDKEKDTIRTLCSIRVDALETLKYKFCSYAFR